MSDRSPANQAPTPNAPVFRRDDDRRRDEARVAALQSQVDELRAALRELMSRQSRGEEIAKHTESVAAQTRLAVEQLRQEAQQTSQARALDENRTRQILAELDARLDDQTRPVRTLQAHVSQLIDASRQKIDDTSQYQQRFDDLVTMIEHLSALGDRTNAVTHTLRDDIEGLRTEIEGLRRDIIRAEDAIKITDQEARRRTAEVKEIAESYSARIDELRADLAHLYDSLEDTRRGLVHVDPSLEELRAGEITLREELTRLQGQVGERHSLVIDMHDDARQETDARFEEIRQAVEQRAERFNERIEEAHEMQRALSYQISDLNTQLEELRQTDAALHRDVWYLHEQRVRVRLEQIQEELDMAAAQRRDAEANTQNGMGNRVRRRKVQQNPLDH